MSGDIVKALRQMNRGDFREPPRVYVSPDQAADEIERLRKTLNEWQWVADDLYKYAGHKTDCSEEECTCGFEDVMREYELLDKLSGRVETV